MGVWHRMVNVESRLGVLGYCMEIVFRFVISKRQIPNKNEMRFSSLTTYATSGRRCAANGGSTAKPFSTPDEFRHFISS